MCQFKSGQAVMIGESEVEVKFLFHEDSHTGIRKSFGIAEANEAIPGLSRFSTPVELVPSKLDFDDPSCWQLVFDAGKPDWWTDGMTEQCKSQLLKAAKADFDFWMGGGEVGGSLWLNGLTSVPEGFRPKVGGVIHVGESN